MALGVADDGRAAAVRLDDRTLGNGLDGVVGAFAVDVGLDPAQQAFDVVVGKRHDVIDRVERRDDLGPLGRRHHRPPRPLQPCDRCVLVHGDDEAIGFGGRALQVPHVADVQHIEAAVGERNRAPRGAVVRDGLHQLGLAQHPSHSLPSVLSRLVPQSCLALSPRPVLFYFRLPCAGPSCDQASGDVS